MASGDLQKRRTTYPPTQTDKATIVSPIVSRYFWNAGGSKLVVQYRPGEIHPKRREMECGRRPNRSDVHLPFEEEAKIEEKTREYFDGLAPKRHSKPNRSDYSSRYVDGFANSDDFNGTNPEQVEFQRLQDDPQKLVYTGTEATDEFVETEYYKDLNCVDKQHHTTGTGFIKMDPNAKSFAVMTESVTTGHLSCHGNPATNDWIPAPADNVVLTSDKPSRSDNEEKK